MSIAGVQTAPPFPAADPDAALRAAEALAGRIGGMIDVAAALHAAARRVDLHGLEGSVGRLCAAVLDLDPAQGRSLRPALEDIAARLAALEARMAPAET